MKEHLLNLIYLQYVQERTLSILSNQAEDSDVEIEIYEAYTDILGVVLDIIGYPKNTEDENAPEEESYNRDWFYQALSDIAMETSNLNEAKEKIDFFYNWVCGETLELYKNKKLKNNNFEENILSTIKK